MPIPADLQPVKAKFSGKIKEQMKALLLKQKQLKEASSDSELPDVKAELGDEEEEGEEEEEKEEDTVLAALPLLLWTWTRGSL